MQIAKARGWAGAVVNFDAVTAFASMLGALVCCLCSRDHPTTEALMATGFTADDVAAMSASETVLQSPHIRRLLSDALSNTWAATQGVQEVEATRRGSEAGEPFANLAFGTLMRRILQRVRERMDGRGLVARLPVYGATPFAPTDDVLVDASAYTAQIRRL